MHIRFRLSPQLFDAETSPIMFNGILSAMGFSNGVKTAQIPSLTGKIALVTGGNTGIGYITVEELSSKGAKVYLAARSPERAHAAIAKLKSKQPDAKIVFLPFDMTSVQSARKAAQTVINNESRLDIVGQSFRPSSLAIVAHPSCEHSRQRRSHGFSLQARQRRRSPIRKSSIDFLPFVVAQSRFFGR